MNKVELCGRLTKDVDVRGEGSSMVARYTLAIDRRFKDSEGNTQTDFINVVAFGKSAEFAEKYLKKGMKMIVCGRIQTGSYTNKDGQKVYTTDVVVEEQEFCESKNSGQSDSSSEEKTTKKASTKKTEKQTDPDDDFMNISDDMGELPW